MATDSRERTYVCVVCGEDISEMMSSVCNWCDGRYHLNQRNDIEGKDCGQVWIDEQYMALQFACDNCLRGEAKGARAEARPAGLGDKTARRRRYRRRA